MSNILSSDFCNYSVSFGTLRLEDLIPLFYDFLTHHVPDAVPADLAYSGKEVDGDPYFDTEEAAFDLDTLFDAMDAVAPDGCYFGALEGDGAALGFWECLDNDLF